MPRTNVVAVKKGHKKNGAGKTYPIVTLTIPIQYTEDIPDKQKYLCTPIEGGVFVFEPVEES